MITRTAKKILMKQYEGLEEGEYTTETIKFFNLVLGNDQESEDFWKTTLTPAIQKKFNVEITRDIPLLHLPQLFFSLQFHTGADFKDTSEYDFTQPKPLLLEHLNGLFSIPHHLFVELSLSLRHQEEDPYQQLFQGYFNQAMLSLNSKISIYQSLYGDENAYVASGLAQLSQAYIGLGDTEKAVICARGSLGAGRQIHATLIPAYMTLISTSEPEEIEGLMAEALKIVRFQLGEIHWFIADIYMASANSLTNYNQFQNAAQYSQQAFEIVHPLLGSGHPKTAQCSLLQGKIQRMMKQFAPARSLIQQALYAMTAAFGSRSVQVAECYYELADVLLDSGKSDEAEESSKSALAIREAQFGNEDPLVIETIQQMALIYDTMGKVDEAFTYYLRLFNFLRSFEDESIFEETIKVLRNMIVLFFRTSHNQSRQTVVQLKRKKIEEEEMTKVFQNLLENDHYQIMTSLMNTYHEKGDFDAFNTLAAIYHIGLDDLSSLSFLQSS